LLIFLCEVRDKKEEINYVPGSVHWTFLIPAHLDKGFESISDLTASTWSDNRAMASVDYSFDKGYILTFSEKLTVAHQVKNSHFYVTLGLRSAMFWDFKQYRMVAPYHHFKNSHQSHLQGSSCPRQLI